MKYIIAEKINSKYKIIEKLRESHILAFGETLFSLTDGKNIKIKAQPANKKAAPKKETAKKETTKKTTTKKTTTKKASK